MYYDNIFKIFIIEKLLYVCAGVIILLYDHKQVKSIYM